MWEEVDKDHANRSARTKKNGEYILRTEDNSSIADTIFDEFFNRVIVFLDSALASTGDLPDINRYALGPEEFNYLLERYYDRDSTLGSSVVYPKWGGSNKSASVQRDGHVVHEHEAKSLVSISQVSPNPISGDIIILNMEVLVDGTYIVSIYSHSGQFLGKLWKGVLQRGSNSLDFPLPKKELANGVFQVSVEDVDGNVLDMAKVAVSK